MPMTHIASAVLTWLMVGFPPTGPAMPGKIIVTAPHVAARGGPSEQCYPTVTLKQGDRLAALHAVPIGAGWVAVKPPPGSFSWVEAKAIRRAADGKTAVVVVDRAPVWVGSSTRFEKPDLSQGALKRGQAVEIVAPDQRTDDGSWTPIRPAAFEVRYVPVSAVAEPAPAKSTAKGSPSHNELAELRARVQELERRLATLEAAAKKN